ncbi:MAG: D-amino acid aminotransferase [Pseudomonadales bacterium]|nr:D-amino acid aminotransferase [Pseudomonadales bacterium]MBO6596152.1 D-amino acid aminotransferase [Pseudomonadales bacterium]MBO6822632.1 D-amino acid aminotransferase [Pseudomonadales bacterium]
MAIAYLNGEWMQPEDARVSVFDRGFMFGDGIYEVMAVYDGEVFTLDQHLVRLQRSLDAIRLVSPHASEEWRSLILEAVDRGQENPAYLYLQVTRGVAAPRNHVYPEVVQPTVLMTVMYAPVLERQNVAPLKVVTKEDFRWGRGDIKVVSLIANGLLKNEAIAEGFDDAILVRDGWVTESTAANVFIVKEGVIVTPPKSNHLLHGITRDHVVDLANEAGLSMEERSISESELLEADEVWVTSTGQEVWPVGQVNGQVIGNGSAGVVWQAVDDLFQVSKRKSS